MTETFRFRNYINLPRSMVCFFGCPSRHTDSSFRPKVPHRHTGFCCHPCSEFMCRTRWAHKPCCKEGYNAITQLVGVIIYVYIINIYIYIIFISPSYPFISPFIGILIPLISGRAHFVENVDETSSPVTKSCR